MEGGLDSLPQRSRGAESHAGARVHPPYCANDCRFPADNQGVSWPVGRLWVGVPGPITQKAPRCQRTFTNG